MAADPFTLPPAARAPSSAMLFALAAVSLACIAAFIAAWMPIAFSIATVFLFAGPHNWMEFRYFMARMPARWGPLTPFFALAIGGVFVLGGANIALSIIVRNAYWSEHHDRLASAGWLSLVVLWVATLIVLRGREPAQKRDWQWAISIGFCVVSLIWMWPVECYFALVYLHPLLAFIFLDREIKHQRPQWRGAYHVCLTMVPVMLGVLWWKLHDAPSLPGDSDLALRISRHAGSSVLTGVSSHLLVATHTFLEMLHYGIWIVAVPLLSFKRAPWQVNQIAVSRRSSWLRRGVAAVFMIGAVAVLILWGGFLTDYPATRDTYFMVAILHVLAEFPFLLRLL
jgi:hypothetical protein